MVRVPRNIINLKTNYIFKNYNNLSLTLNSKWSDVARDYGNGNRTYDDERTDDYFVNDLNLNYNLSNYNIFFNVTNVLDEKYETARDYSQMNRSFNLGIKKIEYIKILNINKIFRPYKLKKRYKIFIAYYISSVRLIDNI